MNNHDIENNIPPAIDEVSVVSDRSSASEREFRRRNMYRCCGGRVDRRLLEYFSQIIIIVIVLSLSITQLMRGANNTELWVSLLSTCVGYVLPGPHLSSTKELDIEPRIRGRN